MRPPKGFKKLCDKLGIPFTEGQVLELNKCIYGLKQAGRYWNKKFVKILERTNFSQSSSDCCCFTSGSGISDLCIVVFYVDDVLIGSKDPRKVKAVKRILSKALPMKHLGPPKLWTISLPNGSYI